MTHTFTSTQTFTRTSAQYLASKVVADLTRVNRYYGQPEEAMVWQYYQELVELLVEDCLSTVEYGFRKNGARVVSLIYEVHKGGLLSDDRAGGVFARADVTGAQWFSYLTYNFRWMTLSPAEQATIAARLPFARVSCAAPTDGAGYWAADRAYSADGVGTSRRMFRPYP